MAECRWRRQAKLRLEFKAELEREVMSLRTEFLQDRLDAERGGKRLRVVPPPLIA